MKLYSLRRATLRAIVVPLTLAVVLTTISALWLSNRAIGMLLDDQMQQEAAFLLLLARHEAAEGESIGLIKTIESRELHDLLNAQTRFRIWSADILVTQSQPDAVAPNGPPPAGFSTQTIAGVEWRVFGIRHGDIPITVEVSEPVAMRSALAEHIVRSLALPLLFLIFAICLIAYWQITAAMKPMARISAEIDARDTGELRPLEGYRLPEEIAPLFAAFNRLIVRLRAVIDREREFADNAAHELRTPLAALKTRAQVVARELAATPAQQSNLDQLVAATDRATGVINQLLQLNRLDQPHPAAALVDFSALTTDLARELAALAIEKSQQFGADITPSLLVRGEAEALRMLVRNLIDNAIRYTPVGGQISVTLEAADGRHVLRIVDDGPGLPPDRAAEAFDRFVRFAKSEAGSGLGLAIVHRITTQHGGTVTLENRKPAGLSAEVRLPAVTGAA